jgi:4a-hydroxytetrahydrobiopterin dehydratase
LNSANTLAGKRCKPCVAGTLPLSGSDAEHLTSQLDGWQLCDGRIRKTFGFKNYYQTIAFVNALAWLSHQQDHHPELVVSYDKCQVEYSTHSIHGLSENDFICAAKVDALFTI